jgi:hypothetical protein
METAADEDDFEVLSVLRLARAFVAPAVAASPAAGAAQPGSSNGARHGGRDSDLTAEEAGCTLWDLAVAPGGAALVLRRTGPALEQALVHHVARLQAEAAGAVVDANGAPAPNGASAAVGAGSGPSGPCRSPGGALLAARLAEQCLGIFANIYAHPELAAALARFQRPGGEGGGPHAAAAPRPGAGAAGGAERDEGGAAEMSGGRGGAGAEGSGSGAGGDGGGLAALCAAALFLDDPPLLSEACRLAGAALALRGEVRSPPHTCHEQPLRAGLLVCVGGGCIGHCAGALACGHPVREAWAPLVYPWP